ncbi:MAG: hypothetical protein ACK4FK_00085 [Ferrovibrio sp.]|uniref:hypothetical protein n=1 Tax=Ferrovibrio sp. TaxID=1917215 RepID=UPI00391C41FD
MAASHNASRQDSSGPWWAPLTFAILICIAAIILLTYLQGSIGLLKYPISDPILLGAAIIGVSVIFGAVVFASIGGFIYIRLQNLNNKEQLNELEKRLDEGKDIVRAIKERREKQSDPQKVSLWAENSNTLSDAEKVTNKNAPWTIESPIPPSLSSGLLRDKEDRPQWLLQALQEAIDKSSETDQQDKINLHQAESRLLKS